jgi:aryl-alcohol dehydrogenase-like predicted oxidoreductase
MIKKKKNRNSFGRREFIKIVATAAFSGPILLSTAYSKSNESTRTKETIHRNEQPTMTYRKLGRTGFLSSRLVFGCGAALTGGKAVRLLQRAFEAGINHFDVGSDIYYKGSERNLAPFLKDHREQVWVVSKAPAIVYTKSGDSITLEQAKSAAKYWTGLMDASLKDLQTDYVDAYYLMAVDNPALVRSEEVYNAFLKAKTAGKVGHFGLSTHKNAPQKAWRKIHPHWLNFKDCSSEPQKPASA